MRISSLGLLIGLTVAGLCVGIGPSSAAEFRARVFAVIDGDTLDLRHDGRTERVRLRGIDCPELKQPYGPQAKRAVAAMVTGVTVVVKPYGKDKRGVTIADLVLDGGRSVSRTLLQEGLAWRVPSPTSDPELEAAEADAQYSKRGLWSDSNPVAPWAYRASKSRRR